MSVLDSLLGGIIAGGMIWGMGEGGFARLSDLRIERKKRKILAAAQRDALTDCPHPEGWWMDPSLDPLTLESENGEEYHKFSCTGFVLTHYNQSNTPNLTDRHFLFATHCGITSSVGFQVTPLGGLTCWHQPRKVTPPGWGIRQFHVYRWCRPDPGPFSKKFPVDQEFYDPGEWKKIERASGKRIEVAISGLIEIQPLKNQQGTGFQRFDKGPKQCASICKLKVEFL